MRLEQQDWYGKTRRSESPDSRVLFEGFPNTHWCKAPLVRSPCAQFCQFRSSSASSSLTFRKEIHHFIFKTKSNRILIVQALQPETWRHLLAQSSAPALKIHMLMQFPSTTDGLGVQLFRVFCDMYLTMMPWSGQPFQAGNPSTISSPVPKKPGSDLQPGIRDSFAHTSVTTSELDFNNGTLPFHRRANAQCVHWALKIPRSCLRLDCASKMSKNTQWNISFSWRRQLWGK